MEELDTKGVKAMRRPAGMSKIVLFIVAVAAVAAFAWGAGAQGHDAPHAGGAVLCSASPDATPPYQARKFPLEGKLDGISDRALQVHRDVLYAGYVKKLREIAEKLEKADRSAAAASYSDYRELKVEESFALDGVVLHEMYFENLGGKGSAPQAATLTLIERDFGSYEKWREDFLACGKAARGWVLLARADYDGKLHNFLLDAHNSLVPMGAKPLLVLDVYEHAYFIDYGADRAAYLDAFFRNIDWHKVEERAGKR